VFHDDRFFGAEDVTLIAGMGIGILMFVGAALAAAAVVASRGSSVAAALAALAGGAIVGGIGAWIVRRLRREHAPEIDIPNIVGEFVLFVRVRTSEREAKAQQILAAHGAEAVRVHEIDLDKRLEDIPLSSLRVDPWLGEEALGRL
jgi:outer membrane lipoprotein SlyB